MREYGKMFNVYMTKDFEEFAMQSYRNNGMLADEVDAVVEHTLALLEQSQYYNSNKPK